MTCDCIHKKINRLIQQKPADKIADNTAIHAAEVLDESAEYIQQLDYEQAEAKARGYLRRNPGLSLLIAGVTGLIVGAVFRRR